MSRAKKHFGQHFLHERSYLDRMVAAIAPQPGDRLVEIGPGPGALTLPLLAATGELTAIELDRDLIPDLRNKAASCGRLEIIEADVLSVDLSALAGDRPLRVVGNLPYYISSPILFHCLHHIDALTDMHFMLQKEVVQRMAAAPGNRIYGRLSVMLQLVCEVTQLFTVPPGAFRPPPKVDSAVVRLRPRAPDQRPDVDADSLSRVVRTAFSQRRKTLSNALSPLLSAERIAETGIDPRARAETLSPADFIRLTKAL